MTTSGVVGFAVVAEDTTASADRLTFLLRHGNAKAIADFFHGMPEKQRRTLIKPLRDFLRSIRWRFQEKEDWSAFNQRHRLATCTVTPAGLAVFSNATATAKFLRSAQRSSVFDSKETEAIKQILADRAPAWLPDLPTALLETLETLEPEGAFRLVETVQEVTGVQVPATREFLRAWGVEHSWGYDRNKLEAAILSNPRLAELLPLMFDDDENDGLFTGWTVFRAAALTAVRDGLVPRAAVLDGSLRRLLRGGQTGAMQNHLAYWNALEATDEEVVERVSSCISLLSSQSGKVARTFLASLKKLSDAGLIDVELALEAASVAVTRPEKNVVKTTLSWLDALAATHRDRAGQIAATIATAFGAQAADLQERAVKLVGKHAKALAADESGRLVAEAQVYLPPDLAATLAGLLGVAPDEAAADAGYPEVAPYVPRPLLPPIGSPAELAEVCGSLMHADPLEAMVFERVLEAIVAFARTDAAGLRAALAPVVERWRPGTTWDWELSQTPRSVLCVLAAAAAGIGETSRRHPHRAGVKQLWSRVRKSGRNWWHRSRTTPADFLVLRGVEILAALGLPDLPPLVSVPTSPSGAIAPDVLAARLRECEALGLVPLETDFHQALLRLPEDCGGVDVSGFRSKAGRRFAAWVRGERVELPVVEMPDPAARKTENWDRRATYMRTATRRHRKDPATVLDLVEGVWSEPERCWDQSDWMVCWPAIVPSRPDLAAVALLGGADWSTALASPESAVALAEQDGPQGATHHVIAARLVDESARLRASGVDAALVLAARGLLDPAELSTALARQVRAVGAGLRRAVPGLRDLANGGAARQSWETIALLLPGVLPPAVPKTLAGTADLLVLGTELASALGVRGPVAGVSELAGKKGGSAVTNAARRLAGVLGGEG